MYPGGELYWAIAQGPFPKGVQELFPLSLMATQQKSKPPSNLEEAFCPDSPSSPLNDYPTLSYSRYNCVAVLSNLSPPSPQKHTHT